MKKVYKIITFLFILFILTSCSKVKVYFDYNCGVDRGYTCNIVNSKLDCTIEEPKCSNKEFIGWYDEKEGGNLIDINAGFNENKTLYAHYKEIEIIPDEPLVEEYTVTFDANGGVGGQKDSVNVVYEGKMPKISTEKTKKENYVFMGWYDDKDYLNGTQYYDSECLEVTNYDKNSNITLYAGWSEENVKNYTITYNSNNANNYTKAQTVMGGKSTKLNSNTFKYDGYDFKGWNTSPDGNGTNYADNSNIVINNNTTLYAIWNPIAYTIKYSCGKGEGTPPNSQEVKFGQTFTTAISTCQKTGYIFSEWYDPTGDHGWTNYSGEWKWLNGQYEIQNNTLILIAEWELAKYTVSFDANGGVGGQKDSINVVYEDKMPKISAEIPSREGYVFMGWYDNKDYLNGTQYYDSKCLEVANYDKNSNTTLYAGWSKENVNNYTITYNSNNTNNYTKVQTVIGGKSTKLNSNTFKYDGYEFKGWNTAKDGKGTNYADNSNIIINKNTTLYAIWNPITYTVKYKCGENGGNPPSIQTVKFGQTFTTAKSTCKKTGYTFSKWYDPTGDHGWTNWTGTWRYVNGQFGIENNVLTLTANWEPNDYNISFDCNGGSKPSGKLNSQKVKYGQSYTLPSDMCTKVGYTQKEWRDQYNTRWVSSNTNNWKWSYDYNPQLKAIWDTKTYSISFNCNGGSKPSGKLNTQEVKYGQSYTLPSDMCTRVGYTQKEWRDQHNARWVSSNTINWSWLYDYSPQLNAIWDAKSYNISFDCNGGSKPSGKLNTQEVKYGQSYTLPSDMCTRVGYTQKEWRDQHNARWVSSNTINWSWSYDYNPNLKAKWEAKQLTIIYYKNDGTNTSYSETFTYDGNMDQKIFSPKTGMDTRTGYTFKGWSFKSDGSDNVRYKYNDVVGNNWFISQVGDSEKKTIKLYAIWEKKAEEYTIKYYCDFGNYASTEPAKTQIVEYGKTVTIKANDCPNNNAKWYDPTGDHGWTNWTGTWSYKNGQYGIKDNTLILTSVPNSRVVDSYNSNTLKYWIEKYDNNYYVTHIWVENAYNQLQMAINPKKNVGQEFEYPRYVRTPLEIMKNEINGNNPILGEKITNLRNKGLIAINASPMINQTSFGDSCPDLWNGTARIPIKIHDGVEIRNSIKPHEVREKEGSNNEKTSNIHTYILGSDGKLRFFDKFAWASEGSSNYNAALDQNNTLYNTIKSYNPRYTFGFAPPLVEYGKAHQLSTGTSTSFYNANLKRQSLCQVDDNNFIIITTTDNGGLYISALTNIMLKYNCVTGVNLDGGGSTSLFYKKNSYNTSNAGLNNLVTSNRQNAEMLYFVEN